MCTISVIWLEPSVPCLKQVQEERVRRVGAEAVHRQQRSLQAFVRLVAGTINALPSFGEPSQVRQCVNDLLAFDAVQARLGVGIGGVRAQEGPVLDRVVVGKRLKALAEQFLHRQPDGRVGRLGLVDTEFHHEQVADQVDLP